MIVEFIEGCLNRGWHYIPPGLPSLYAPQAPANQRSAPGFQRDYSRLTQARVRGFSTPRPRLGLMFVNIHTRYIPIAQGGADPLERQVREVAVESVASNTAAVSTTARSSPAGARLLSTNTRASFASAFGSTASLSSRCFKARSSRHLHRTGWRRHIDA